MLRFQLLAICSMLVCSALQWPAEAKDASLENANNIRTTEFFASRTRHDQDWLKDTKVGGFIVSGSEFPSAGKLLIHGPGDRLEACSGVLISPNKFLTAAHCVCPEVLWKGKTDNQRYSDVCREKSASLTFNVLFAGIGIFSTVGTPAIPDDYRPVNLGIDTGETVNEDIAILQLAVVPPVQPSEVSVFRATDVHISVGYGKLSFADVPADSGFSTQIHYEDGPKQLAKYLPAHIFTWKDCGKDGASKDSLCGDYNPLPREGILADAASCGGDSGSPLFGLKPGTHRYVVVGLASYVFPVVNEDDPCDSSQAIGSHFVMLEDYLSWIHEAASTSERTEKVSQTCRSSILSGPGQLSLKMTIGSFSLSAFERDVGHIKTRPPVEIKENSEIGCKSDLDFGIQACQVRVPTVVNVDVGVGHFEQEPSLVQIVTCEKR